MEPKWMADRAKLHRLSLLNPRPSLKKLAALLGYSVGWVKKWLTRFDHTPKDTPVSLDRRKKLKDPLVSKVLPQALVKRILELRDNLPQTFHRVVGPRTILTHLKKDQTLKEASVSVPNSTTPIWHILRTHGRIVDPKLRGPHQPWVLPLPGHEWQLDFKDRTLQTVEPGGKKQHQIEVLDGLDVGTSIFLGGPVSENYNAKTALEAVLGLFKQWGCPDSVTFDRDPRWVGSHSGKDFPAPFVRMLYCLSIKPNICPPHRPDLNGFVERFHRSLGSECLKPLDPQDVGAVRECVERYGHFYNYERPHQGLSCKDQPPRLAYPEFPPLRGLPVWVDPDKWIRCIDGQLYPRRVSASGSFDLGSQSYYLGRDYAKSQVIIQVDATSFELVVNGLPNQTKPPDRRHKWTRRQPQSTKPTTEVATPPPASTPPATVTLAPPPTAITEKPPAGVVVAASWPAKSGSKLEMGQPPKEEKETANLVLLKRLPMKGAYKTGEISFEQYEALIKEEAALSALTEKRPNKTAQ